MNSTTRVTVAALVLGLLLAGGGSVLLAHARAAVQSDRRWPATITEYPAALAALLGFLLSSVAGAALCWRLVPIRGATAVLAGIAAGVVLFALAGTGFARLADRVEARRLRQVPAEVHRPISPTPPNPPALPQPRAALSEAPPPRPVGAEQRAPSDPLSTRLVEVRRPPAGRPAPILDTPPAGVSVPGAPLVAGWMYHDEADCWFLAVGTAGGALLLGLPAFALVDADGADAPVGELRRVGAAELTVLPEAGDPAEHSAPDGEPPVRIGRPAPPTEPATPGVRYGTSAPAGPNAAPEASEAEGDRTARPSHHSDTAPRPDRS